jgi:uncharacterized protein YcnI
MKVSAIVFVLAIALLTAWPVSAHVVVKPSEVGIGSTQVFTTGVPNERESNVTGVRLVIPAGVESVTPYVKPDWTIEMKKSGEDKDAQVTEISWTGGTIPLDLRDDFVFRATVPAEEGTLTWKAYQTYADGTVVSWDQTEAHEHLDDENSTVGPASTTEVVNDLEESTTATTSHRTFDRAQLAAIFSLLALGVSITALVRKK